MHKILFETHKAENIDIMRAREYYFNKARDLNNIWRKICLFAPFTLFVLGTIIGTWLDFREDDKWLEIIVGITAIIAFIIDFFLQLKIDKLLDKSNALREEYDCRVLGIKKNLFYEHNSDAQIKELIENAPRIPNPKSEVWYRETFSDDDTANAIVLCMDNTIYTKYVYKERRLQMRKGIIWIAIFFIIYTILYLATPDNFFLVMINPFMLFIAIFDCVKELVEAYMVSAKLISSAENLIEYVEENREEILSGKESKETILRSIEDVVYRNREQSLFLPDRLRNKYLENKDNVYYSDLEIFKKEYWKNAKVTKPEKPDDYDIPAVLFDMNEEEKEENACKVVNLQQVHVELLSMLKDIQKVLDDNNIEFFLDGGTLLGAARTNKFLPWDDDIDIAIHRDKISDAMKYIKENLGKKYVVQDYDSEKHYSPRLSRFRIRQLESVSKVDEKDSVLFEKYRERGIFIDVYSYTPILCNKFVDIIYRRLFIHPLNKKTLKKEEKWFLKNRIKKGAKEGTPKELETFFKIKDRYIKRYEWYRDHAKCETYYSYEPLYIENPKKAGPYIKKEYLYSSDKNSKTPITFEGGEYSIPANIDEVLKAFYGEDWNISPYKKLGEWDNVANEEFKYCKDIFDSSKYKHIKAAYITGKVHDFGEK